MLGCAASLVALTGSTTDGVNTVLSGLDLRAGDEILTSDEEHPGLLAPLGRARRRHGVNVRVLPFRELAGEVRSSTRLVACSHVSWVNGKVADIAALRAAGAPVLLDAAQALGAVPVDVRALGVDFYAASGQKWLCGPEGSGCLYVRPERLDELLVPWPGYGSVADPEQALEFEPAEGVKRLDHGFPTGLKSAWALASLEVLGRPGWSWVHERAASLAASLADRLAELGLEVVRSRPLDARLLEGRRRRRRGRAIRRERVRAAEHPGARARARVGRRVVLRGGARPFRAARSRLVGSTRRACV